MCGKWSGLSESDPASSSSSSDSLASFDPSSFSWKTSQLSLFGGLTDFSWSSLRWGKVMRAGQLVSAGGDGEPRTFANAGGALPTPTASDYGSNNHGIKEGKAESKASLGQLARRGFIPTPKASDGDKAGPESHEFQTKRAGVSGLLTDAGRAGLERWIDAQSAWETFRLGGGGGGESWPQWLPQPAVCRGT